MGEFKDFKCKYCKKVYSSRNQLDSTRCQSHPRGMWKGNHACDNVQGSLAEIHNAQVRREQSIKTLDKLCEESKQERAKELEEEKKSFITSLKNEPLGTFFCNMVNHWDEDRASSTIFELTTRFTIGRDILIPQGIIRPSWKGFFSQLQVEIMDRGFWSFAYWMTRAYKANINDIGEYKYPDLIATIINNWEKDEAIRILKGFEMGILKLEEFAKSKDENNKVDASWLPRLVKLREEKIRDGEFWEGLSWIIKIVKLTS